MSIVGGEIKGIQSKAAEKQEVENSLKQNQVILNWNLQHLMLVRRLMLLKKMVQMEKAPDGEHQIDLKDESGNEVKIRVMVKDGMITERENVEEMKSDSEDEMGGFVEAFAQAMKRLETKIDSLSAKQELLDSKFQKFSKEPAGSRVIKNQINQETFSSPRLEGWKRLREQISN